MPPALILADDVSRSQPAPTHGISRFQPAKLPAMVLTDGMRRSQPAKPPAHGSSRFQPANPPAHGASHLQPANPPAHGASRFQPANPPALVLADGVSQHERQNNDPGRYAGDQTDVHPSAPCREIGWEEHLRSDLLS